MSEELEVITTCTYGRCGKRIVNLRGQKERKRCEECRKMVRVNKRVHRALSRGVDANSSDPEGNRTSSCLERVRSKHMEEEERSRQRKKKRAYETRAHQADSSVENKARKAEFEERPLSPSGSFSIPPPPEVVSVSQMRPAVPPFRPSLDVNGALMWAEDALLVWSNNAVDESLEREISTNFLRFYTSNALDLAGDLVKALVHAMSVGLVPRSPVFFTEIASVALGLLQSAFGDAHVNMLFENIVTSISMREAARRASMSSEGSDYSTPTSPMPCAQQPSMLPMPLAPQVPGYNVPFCAPDIASAPSSWEYPAECEQTTALGELPDYISRMLNDVLIDACPKTECA